MSSLHLAKHPAKYSQTIMDRLSSLIPSGTVVLDPFAGTGRIHQVANSSESRLSIGIEIESEWAQCAGPQLPESTFNGDLEAYGQPHAFTVVADSTHLHSLVTAQGWPIDVIATSATYGNRMADNHDAKDTSVRNTYRHQLGRPLTDGNTGQMHFARNGDYEALHEAIWQQCFETLPSGGLMLLNVSDFLRTRTLGPRTPLHNYETVIEDLGKSKDKQKVRVRCEVTQWHTETLSHSGFTIERVERIETPRNRHGANGHVRVNGEHIIVAKKVLLK